MKKIESRELVSLVSEKAFENYTNTDPMEIVQNDDGSYSIHGCIETECSNTEDLNDFLESLSESDDTNKVLQFLDKYAEDYFYNPDALSDSEIKEWADDLDHPVYPDNVSDEEWAEDAINWIHSNGKEVNEDTLWEYVETGVPVWKEN